MLKKILSITAIYIAFSFSCNAQTASGNAVKYQLSTHILDISKGLPAGNVEIELLKLSEKKGQSIWTSIKKSKTQENGRVDDFLEFKNGVSNEGTYKLVFYTQPYFTKDNRATFFPFIEVVFNITDKNLYHVPITLSDFGYSTYRGS